MARIALTELRKNPELLKCDPYSFLGAIIQCSQLGLEPGSGLGHAFLVPFANRKLGIIECQFIPGYRGLIDLARRSGHITNIDAEVVWDEDEWKHEKGDEPRIIHTPYQGPIEDAGKIKAVYAIARFGKGGVQREVMYRWQIDAIKASAKGNPVWDKHFDEMARKSVVRKVCKYLPMSPQLASVISADDANYKGETQSNWSVLNAEYTPIPAEPDFEKFQSIQGGAGQPGNDAIDLRKIALANLNDAVKRLTKLPGGDAGYFMKGINTRDASHEELQAVADQMNAWQPEGAN